MHNVCKQIQYRAENPLLNCKMLYQEKLTKEVEFKMSVLINENYEKTHILFYSCHFYIILGRALSEIILNR